MRCPRPVAAVLLLTTVSACGGGNDSADMSIAFPPAPLPMYSPGDSYTFDDGSVDTVVSATDAEVHWRTLNGSRFVTARDVLLPPVSWTDATTRGRRSFSAADTLFPLQPGGSATVTASVTQQSSRSRLDMAGQEHWQCQVGDAQRLSTDVGMFDTVQVDCTVGGAAGGQPMLRTFFYAPSIGYYVRRIDQVGDAPPHTVQLVAWTDGNPPLPDSALQQRVEAMQRALENQDSGAVVNWQDTATQVSGSVEPVHTQRDEAGHWCRDFQEHVGAFGRRYALAGEACRGAAGGWQVESIASLKAG
jgi:hypothetical protein